MTVSAREKRRGRKETRKEKCQRDRQTGCGCVSPLRATAVAAAAQLLQRSANGGSYFPTAAPQKRVTLPLSESHCSLLLFSPFLPSLSHTHTHSHTHSLTLSRCLCARAHPPWPTATADKVSPRARFLALFSSPHILLLLLPRPRPALRHTTQQCLLSTTHTRHPFFPPKRPPAVFYGFRPRFSSFLRLSFSLLLSAHPKAPAPYVRPSVCLCVLPLCRSSLAPSHRDRQ